MVYQKAPFLFPDSERSQSWHREINRMAQEPNRNQEKSEPLEPFFRASKRGWKIVAARKLSKRVEKILDNFWRFLTFFALRGKMSKSVEKYFDTFWRFYFRQLFGRFENCPKSVEKVFWHFLTIFGVFWRGPFALAPFAVCWVFPGPRNQKRSRNCRNRFSGTEPKGPGRTKILRQQFSLPRGPCKTLWWLAAKIDSPLSRGTFGLAITLAQIVS